MLGPDALSVVCTFGQTIRMTYEALWPREGEWTWGQDLTLVLTEIPPQNSLEPLSPQPMMGMIEVSMSQGCSTSKALELAHVPVGAGKILKEFEVRSYMWNHFVKNFTNKRWH